MPTETRHIIKEAFIQQYYAQGMSRLSVKMLCQQAHIARTTFYAYYDHIFAVLEEIEEELITDLYAINESFKGVNLAAYQTGDPFPFFDETLAYIQSHLIYFQALLYHSEATFLYRWRKIIKHHFREKYQMDSLALRHMELTLEVVATSIIGAYAYWVAHIEEIPAEEFAAVVFPRIAFDWLVCQTPGQNAQVCGTKIHDT